MRCLKMLDWRRIRAGPKREPPTIDLEATEVSSETRHSGNDRRRSPGTMRRRRPRMSRGRSRFRGASAARFAAHFTLGHCAHFRPGRRRAGDRRGLDAGMAAPAAAPSPRLRSTLQPSTVSPRVSPVVESKAGKPQVSPPDPAAAARIEALEKSLASLRDEFAGVRAQSEKLAAIVNDAKSTPGEAAARRICPPSTSASPSSSAPRARKAPRSRKRAPRSPTASRRRPAAAPYRGGRLARRAWFGSAIPIPPRWRRRNRSPTMPLR